jgi:ABC-type transporter Mla subunit MlaD
MDDALDKAKDLAGDNADKLDGVVDQAAEFVDEKTGGKFSDQIDSGADAAKEQLGNLGND